LLQVNPFNYVTRLATLRYFISTHVILTCSVGLEIGQDIVMQTPHLDILKHLLHGLDSFLTS